MKRKFLCIIGGLLVHASTLTAAGYPVFDVSGWLTALDQLYSQYDMVMNSITQIENQYLQIQQAVERAKNIDWDNIRFDGDFDLRNDIRDANRRVNTLLNQARKIQDTLTAEKIMCGETPYSLADLCGRGQDDRSFFTAVTDMKNFMTDNMSKTVEDIEKGLTEEQRIAIWRKYGIHPKNYIFVQQSVANVKKNASNLMAKATQTAFEMQSEEKISKTNAIIEAAYSQRDSDGNITQGAINEANLYLTQQMIDELMSLGKDINDFAGLAASRMIADENERQAEADERQKQETQSDTMNRKVPNYFRK